MNRNIDDPRTTEHRTEAYRTYHDWSGTQELSTTIVMAVAEVTDDDPLDLPVLREVLDPDGLNEVFVGSEDGPPVDIRFEYAGFEVVVSGDGRISVFER